MLDNPFTYGNPISDPRRFFGREREVSQIFGRLHNEECESTSVVGDRRIGKTSLLNYLADPGVQAAHGFEPGRYNFVYINLQMVDEAMGAQQLWRRLLGLMRPHFIDQEIIEPLVALERGEHLDVFALDEFFQQIDDKGQYVVLLLDDFEQITASINFGPDFYYQLRVLLLHHQLAIVTSSRLELLQLFHDADVKSSPFFNIFANINLGSFSHDEFRLMVSHLLRGRTVQFSELEMEWVLDLAGLHPFFLQIACCALYKANQEGLSESARASFLNEQFRAESIPYLVDYWDDSDDHERIVLTAAALLEQATKPRREFSLADLRALFSSSEPSVKRLEKRGLLRSRADRYFLFSSVFGPWILNQIAAEPSEQQSYIEWLAENRRHVARIAWEQGGFLKEVLPKIRTHYRQLILTWASDPETLAAMTGLLKRELAQVK